MSATNPQQLLQQGIQAARNGDPITARQFLEAAILQDEHNELAWIWLASVVTTNRERRVCLEKVLQINPKNQRARDALNRLVGVAGKPLTRIDAAELQRGMARGNVTGRTSPLESAVLVVVLGIGLVAVLVITSILFAPTVQIVTPTPQAPEVRLTQVAQATQRVLALTPSLTPTFPGVRVTLRPDVTLPPTFTPTDTPTPTETSLPSATPFPYSDFTFLYTARDEGELVPSLYEVRVDGANERRLAGSVRDVQYDAFGELVVFARDVTYESQTVSELFVGPANNPDAAEQVTTIRTASAYQPTFSPDSQQVVFVSDFDGDEELWLLDLTSRVTIQLTLNNGIDRHPHWSVDGTQILFTSDRDTPGFTEIYTLTFVGGAIGDESQPERGHLFTRLTNDTGNSYAPRWSPGGRRIAYLNDRSGFGSVYVMDANGQRQSSLTNDRNVEALTVTWSPDGRYIAFISNRLDDRFQAYLISQDRRELIRIVNNNRQLEALSFRPDLIYRLNPAN